MSVQLDHTRIVVRERNYLEILDLALRVVRAFAGPLALAAAAGILPMAALNGLLVARWCPGDITLDAPARPILLTALLVLLEAPLATAGVTLCLGAAVFAERPSARQLAVRLLRRLPQLVWYQVLFRFWYFRWSYFGEVVLLEGNPWHVAGADGQSSRTRAAVLHRGMFADLFARSVFSLLLGPLLGVAMWWSVYYVMAVLLSQWEWDPAMFAVAFPAVLWIVVAFFAVVRFLSYLDLRIRREGWEVELLLRAELDRLRRSQT
jgi:hypothetical protein